jgi:hypothetical protein
MTIKQLWKTAFAGAAALLAACSDSTGSSNTGPGSLSFTYSGARTGSYSASGTFKQTSSSFVKQPFAVGVSSNTSGGSALAMVSYVPVTSSTGNMILLGIPNRTSGTVDLDDSCTGTNTVCPFAAILFNTNPDLEEDDSQIFTFTSGQVNITSNTGKHVTGTFSGTAETLLGDSVITITNGTFDMPVRTQSSLSGNRVLARVPVGPARKPE